MSDIKMSECFSLPVDGVYECNFLGEYSYTIYDGRGDILISRLPDDVNAEAIAHAVNNHDRLVEENKRLRELDTEELSVKIFDAIFDSENLVAMRKSKIIKQELGYSLSVKAIIKCEIKEFLSKEGSKK